MKKLSAILAITICFAACGSGNDRPSDVGPTASSAAATDSTTRASDSVMQSGDTSALNQPLGDTTSQSGTHGQGSGSRVGGGNSGGPQSKKGH